ncbi:MAG: hypothetical protein RSB76_03420 [Clostridia bacterium]
MEKVIFTFSIFQTKAVGDDIEKITNIIKHQFEVVFILFTS